MKYYLIVGEASGDLHASHLMASLKRLDKEAEFRFFGGDLMATIGGIRVRHYKELAYMGFIPVLLHLRTIFQNMSFCKQDILSWNPDCVILVDYPGFNLDIAKFLHKQKSLGLWKGKVFYYISPKIWAWKEWRIKAIKRDIDELFSILPFEVDFFEKKHHYPIHYVGNPTADEVREFLATDRQTREDFCKENGLDTDKPIIALLAGSRKQEIKDNLPAMMDAIRDMRDYHFVVAGAPSIDYSYYYGYLALHKNVKIVNNKTYSLLKFASAALVTSGTATLETAMFRVPQVVCYKTPLPHLIRWCFNHIIKCKYISLVNLIADKEIVQELMCERFSVRNIKEELKCILPGREARQQMIDDYEIVHQRLGNESAPDNAAKKMIELLSAQRIFSVDGVPPRST